MKLTTLQDAAKYYASFFERRTRDNGEQYYAVRDLDDGELKSQLTQLCMEAHGDMFPDDWRYSFIIEALQALSECDDPDEIQLEPDVYTAELTSWLGSNVNRPAYCDEAAEEYGRAESIIGQIQTGQYQEKSEVLYLVRAWLERVVSSVESSDDSTEVE